MTAVISEEVLDQFSRCIAGRMGLFFPPERRSDLERGLRKAAAGSGSDAESFARSLMRSPMTKAHIEALASHLTVGETYFFRDSATFNILEARLLPELIRKRSDSGRNLRIWSAGCATGEEPRTISLLLRKLLPDFQDWNITILGTDINPSFLGKASRGIYSEWSFRDVPQWVKDRYFKRTKDGRYRIREDTRNSVTFSYHNLAEDPYPPLSSNTEAMDIIFCRNVLMYFSRSLQKKVVRKLCDCLVPDGLLILTPIESSAALCLDVMHAVMPGTACFRKGAKTEQAGKLVQPDRTGPAEGTPPFSLPVSPVVSLQAVPVPVAGVPETRPAEVAPSDRSDPCEEALSLFAKGRYDEAEEIIQALMSGAETAARPFALLSRMRANRGGLAEARSLCERAIVLDKMNPCHHYLYGTILQELGLDRQSADSFKRTLYLDPDFVLAHFALGIHSRQQGRTRESEKHFENALSALVRYRSEDIVPQSDGMTAGRLEEIIMGAMREDALV